MSSTVRSFGFLAILASPIESSDEREELDEKLYDADSGLSINYEGTMVVYDMMRHKPMSDREDIYHFTIGAPAGATPETMAALLKTHGIEIVEGSTLPYSSIWYNGSDSPMDSIKVVDYRRCLGLGGANMEEHF